MAAMNKTQRKELIEILERKYQRKVAQITQDERAKAEKDVVPMRKKAEKAEKDVQKAIDAALANVSEDVRSFLSSRIHYNVSSYSIANERTVARIKREYGDLREKLDDLPERLFLASVQGGDVAKIMAEFSALD